MSLTEQVPSTITIAVQNPVRAFKFDNLSIECVKAYIIDIDDYQDIHLIRILDAIKDCKHIPGTSPKIVYNRILKLHVALLEYGELKKLTFLSKKVIIQVADFFLSFGTYDEIS